MLRPRLAIGLALLPALALSACTRAEERGAQTFATTLTVYLSLPFQGAAGAESQATADGARLALSRAGGRAGEFIVKLSVLDDARTGSERWDPEQTAENANTALRDRTTIAYLGEGPSGATAISLPILNAAGIAQISPTSSYTGLTQAAGGGKGEPEKYYPSGVRSFARPIPSDREQLPALAGLVSAGGCRQLALVDDGEIDGRGITAAVAATPRFGSAQVLDPESLRADEELDPQAEATKLLSQGPDCVLLAARSAARFSELFDALHAADPGVRLFGSAGLATPETAQAIAPGTARGLRLVAPGGPWSPKGERIAAAYAERFGRPARVASLYGYEAMELALAAVRTAGARGNNREAVEKALFALGDREGPFGSYRLTAQGDVSEGGYLPVAVRDGRLAPARATP